MALKIAQSNYLSASEYLSNEFGSDIKHEYINGTNYAMAGASRNHNILSNNIVRVLGNHLAETPCVTFSSDMKVKVVNDFFYPDVMVACHDEQGNEYYTEAPVIIVEVLSNHTRRRDKTTKLQAYKGLPTLQEYVLIDQYHVEIEIYRRTTNWFPARYFLGDEVTFESIDLTLSVVDIYRQVNNEEMREYVQQAKFFNI